MSFRYHTHERAIAAGLGGWVRNLPDGRVEMLLYGTQEAVESVITWAHTGPPMAQVETVEVSEVKDHFPKDPFFIRRDGGKLS